MPKNSLTTWQTKILPFAFILLSSLALIFIVLYVYQIMRIQNSFLDSSNYTIQNVLKNGGNLNLSHEDKLYHSELLTILNRHYSASLIIKSRIITLNLSFLTGMILCFMGALFILGKFSESETSIKTESEKVNVSLVSSSPGIILCSLGIFLISISIFSKTDLMVADVPVYLKNFEFSSGETPIDTMPKDVLIDTLKKLTISK